MPFHASDFCHEVSPRLAFRRPSAISVPVMPSRALARTMPADSGVSLGSHRILSTASRGAHLILCLCALQHLVTGLYRSDPFSIILAAAFLMIWLNVALIVLLLKPSGGSHQRVATGNWRGHSSIDGSER
jgi:hypothetical protein